MRQKPDKNMWLNHYIVCVAHPATCSFRQSVDIPVGNRAKQNSTELRRGDLGMGGWLLSTERVAPFF